MSWDVRPCRLASNCIRKERAASSCWAGTKGGIANYKDGRPTHVTRTVSTYIPVDTALQIPYVTTLLHKSPTSRHCSTNPLRHDTALQIPYVTTLLHKSPTSRHCSTNPLRHDTALQIPYVTQRTKGSCCCLFLLVQGGVARLLP